jgi:hypothetical protein
MNTLGLDIGGANLKAAHSGGTVRCESFEVWRRPAELARALALLVRQMPAFDVLAIAMTAELCDCYESRADGVHAVLDAVEQTRGKGRSKRSVPARVWLTTGRFGSVAAARAQPIAAASANWLALATWAGRLCTKGPAIVIDVGSTTTDIIPLRDGSPVPRGRTDLDRLASGELVYAGCRRTPVPTLVPRIELDRRSVRVASENFATTGDAYVWLGDLPEEPRRRDTSDGRPTTRSAAAARLARVIGADRSMLKDKVIDQIARQVAEAQRRDLLRAVSQVEMGLGQHASTIVLAGSGEFVARNAMQRLHKPPEIISVAEQIGSDVSTAACAHALATLAAEQPK